MKQNVFLALTMAASLAFAQAPAPTKEAAKPEPMKEAAKAMPVKQAAAAKKPRRWNEDARHCLERTSNTEIIKCAEEFF